MWLTTTCTNVVSASIFIALSCINYAHVVEDSVNLLAVD